MPVPPAEVEIDEPLVRALLRDQHPDLADRRLRFAAEGWDNATWRLGDDLAVRLPRRALGAELIAHERRWLPGLALRIPVAVPTPVRLGEPGEGYPWPWHVVPWYAGRTADRAPLDARGARRLGAALGALHRPALPSAPHNPYRSIHLSLRDPPVDVLRRARYDHGLSRLQRVWQAALDVPEAAEPTWVHGDVHVRNLLVRGGDLAAILDWGDLCAGDPAVDLGALWTVLDAGHGDAFRGGYGPIDDALLARARGWALVFSAIVWVTHRHDDQAWARLAHTTLQRL